MKDDTGQKIQLLWFANRMKAVCLTCRTGMLLAGAGGPGALRTSPPVRRPKSVDTDPHAALAGLTCRASPANSSIAGGAALDSVRLRRNCSLLLCVPQSSSLTCARGADRACAREKAWLLWDVLVVLMPERRHDIIKVLLRANIVPGGKLPASVMRGRGEMVCLTAVRECCLREPEGRAPSGPPRP